METERYVAQMKIFWQNYYLSTHGIEINTLCIDVPLKPDGDGWIPLCIAQGLTPNREFNSWTFPKWKVQDDLDALAHKNQRNTTKTYFIWVKNGAEPDAEFLGKTTNQVDAEMKIGMTLLERLVLQSYAHRMGLVLDKKGITFCSGSRTFEGFVPSVCLNDNYLVCIDWCFDSYQNNAYGIRKTFSTSSFC